MLSFCILLRYSAFLQFFLYGTATALDTLGATAYGAQRRGVGPLQCPCLLL
jgi:hypothetical protein